MFVKKQILFILCGFIGFCQCSLTTFGKTKSPLIDLDSIEPCSIKDSECLTALYQKIISGSANGIPEIGMIPTEPFVLKNESVSVLDLVTITMEDGVAKGVKNCVIHKVRADLEVRNLTMDFTCDMVIEGKYRVTSSPMVKNLIGREIQGEGNAKVEIGKLHIRSGYEFLVRKGEDDEIYCTYDYPGMKFKFTFGKFRVHGDNLYIGDQDYIKPAVRMINNNWKFILSTFGKPFVQKGMNIFFRFTHMFYDNVPARKIITEDLSYLLP